MSIVIQFTPEIGVIAPTLPPGHWLDVRYSKDGGRNWSDWRQLDMGGTGDFVKRLELRRLGRGRQWVFDIRVTDTVRADLISGAIMPEATDS